jgi:hypothetical protein
VTSWIEVANTQVADGHIRGQLRDASGGVPRDVWLTLYAAGRNEGLFVDFDPATGAFEYGPLQPGRYSLRVIRGGQTVTSGEPFDVARGETRDVGLLQMTDGGYLELELSGIPAEDLPGLRLTLDREVSPTESLSLENGRFRSRKLAPGKWTLSLGLIGGGWCFREQEIEIVSGDTTALELTAVRSVKVPIVCTFADPSAVWETIEYEVRDDQGERVLHSDLVGPDKDGRLRLHGLALPAGEYELEAWTDTGLRALDHFQIVGPTCALEREIVLR